ncbi:MAG: hypothetical protein AAGI30_00305 [Planctomycetota bacterium]
MRERSRYLYRFLRATPTIVMAGGVCAQTFAVTDGLGDGDRDNDAVLEALPEDLSDIGLVWFIARGTSGISLGVQDDSGGIGSGNALSINLFNTDSNRAAVANVPEATLELGDRAILTFTARATSNVAGDPALIADRAFRFGIYNTQGTPVTADGGSEADGDIGYVVQNDIGPAQMPGTTADRTVDIRFDLGGVLLGGSQDSFGASTNSPVFALDDSAPRVYTLVIERTSDGTGGDGTDGIDDMRVTLSIDGEVAESDSHPDPGTFTFDSIAIGSDAAVLDVLIDDVQYAVIRASEPTPDMDGFGDGDRDNDGVLDGPFDDLADLGFGWFAGRGTSGIDLSVTDDQGGIGNGSALLVDITNTSSNRAAIANVLPAVLELGDRAVLEATVRAIDDVSGPTNPLRSDRGFRFGIYDSAGTMVTGDMGGPTTDDDLGYVVQADVGDPQTSGSADRTVDIRFDLAGTLLGGSQDSFGANSNTVGFGLDDSDPKTYVLVLERVPDDTGGDGVDGIDDMRVSLIVDGQVAEVDEHPDPATFIFDQIVFGTNADQLRFALDDVRFSFIDASDITTDGFGDGDFDNDSNAEGPIEDLADVGFPWALAAGTSGVNIRSVVDDATGGGGNAFNIGVSTTSTRAHIARFPRAELAGAGDSVEFAFDIRFLPPVAPNDRRFRFGIFDQMGTFVVGDTGSSEGTTDDDLGYNAQLDIGNDQSTSGGERTATVTVRQDPAPTILGGSNPGLGGSLFDESLTLGETWRRVGLTLTLLGDGSLDVELAVDGSVVVTGNDPAPLTLGFDAIVFGTDLDAIPAIYRIDNVVVTGSSSIIDVDLNDDGFVDAFDRALFLDLVAVGDLAADLDGDSDVDADDNTVFTTAFDDARL